MNQNVKNRVTSSTEAREILLSSVVVDDSGPLSDVQRMGTICIY